VYTSPSQCVNVAHTMHNQMADRDMHHASHTRHHVTSLSAWLLSLSLVSKYWRASTCNILGLVTAYCNKGGASNNIAIVKHLHHRSISNTIAIYCSWGMISCRLLWCVFVWSYHLLFQVLLYCLFVLVLLLVDVRVLLMLFGMSFHLLRLQTGLPFLLLQLMRGRHLIWLCCCELLHCLHLLKMSS
jgi:hypothetical protein